MSRIGKKAIPIPESVKVSLDSNCIKIKGPKGTIEQNLPTSISIEIDENKKFIQVRRPDNEKRSKSLQGLIRALINNAVLGVTTGFQKSLEIVGTGYNARIKGKQLELQVGFSLPKTIMIPEGITVELPTPTKIVLKGCNKEQIGQFAFNIRAIHPPDSYKGKGIRYENEVIELKEGKSFAGAGG